MGLIKFFKKWTLPCSMAIGACVYLLFSEVDFLIPIGNTAGPFFIEVMPFLIFAMLYVTFCKIRLHDLRLHAWHGWLQAIRIVLAGLLVWVMTYTEGAAKLILEGMFVCIMCPTAAAAAVITEKLGVVLSAGRKRSRHYFCHIVPDNSGESDHRADLAFLLRHGHTEMVT